MCRTVESYPMALEAEINRGAASLRLCVDLRGKRLRSLWICVEAMLWLLETFRNPILLEPMVMRS